MPLKEQFITDENGKTIGVFLTIEAYQTLLDQLEELEAIQAYDAAIAEEDEEIPFEVAIAEIEENC
ncbi:unknown protein [Stanieria sp. NIES-3757]|nr:unknown protein [Stanieria sp. NIES-3757]